MPKTKSKSKKNEREVELPKTIGISFSDVQRSYFPTEAQYITEKDAEQDARHQPERTLAQLMQWTRDPAPHVRCLCSEGTRPRLPWAPRIPAFVADPSPVLPLLEALKDDPELYVRRSVANHLGDIAKDHPEVVFPVRALAGARQRGASLGDPACAAAPGQMRQQDGADAACRGEVGLAECTGNRSSRA